MFQYNTPVTVTRPTADGEVRMSNKIIVAPDSLTFRVDADVEVGDVVKWVLPNKKTKTVTITSVDVLQSPFGGSLDHTTARYSVAAPRPTAANRRVELPGLHAAVSDAAGALFADGHYSNAAFEALRAVENAVQVATGSTTSGRKLMGEAFGGPAPALDVTTTSGANATDEREGFALLFMGAISGVRNPRGHGSSVVDTAEEALEYLALASILMRRLDVAAEHTLTSGA